MIVYFQDMTYQQDHSYFPETPLHQKLSDFRDKEKYCDVQIRVQDKTFSCHRVVLASASEYFDAMFGGRFKESSSEIPVITLLDIDAVTFKSIIELIYTGCKPAVNVANVRSLLKIGQFLGMHDLVTKCEEFICDNLKKFSVDVFEIFSLARSASAFLKDELSSYIP